MPQPLLPVLGAAMQEIPGGLVQRPQLFQIRPRPGQFLFGLIQPGSPIILEHLPLHLFQQALQCIPFHNGSLFGLQVGGMIGLKFLQLLLPLPHSIGHLPVSQCLPQIGPQPGVLAGLLLHPMMSRNFCQALQLSAHFLKPFLGPPVRIHTGLHRLHIRQRRFQ